MLLQKHESCNSMRSQSDEAWNPPLEHPHETLLGGDLRHEGEETISSFGAHYSRFDNVNRTANRSGHETGH